MITGAMRTTPTKVLEMLLDLPTLEMVVESTALMAAYHLKRPDPRNLEMRHNRIWVMIQRAVWHYSLATDRILDTGL